MAISVTWPTGIIHVPQADLTPVPGFPNVYELNLYQFHLELRDLEDDVEGMVWPQTHIHISPYVLSGATSPHVILLVNGYKVEFEDAAYAVNLVGGNSNLGDSGNIVINQVSVRSFNSFGLVGAAGGADAQTIANKIIPHIWAANS